MIKWFKKNIKQKIRQIQFSIHEEKPFSSPKRHDIGEIFIFIRSWNRPLYLWACLDNLYRNTSKDVHFVLIDNASTDPLVKKVIEGFERRGMFYSVHYMERNHGTNQQLVFKKYRKEIGKYFFLLDSDITIHSRKYHWDKMMIDIAERKPELSLIGSSIDTSDFVEFKVAKKLEPNLSENQIHHLIKGRSVERRNPLKAKEVIQPFSPPGRLLLVKTSTVDKVGLPIGNTNLCHVVKTAGFRYGISTRIVHRHLSLLNLYDYPNYDFKQLHRYLSGQ